MVEVDLTVLVATGVAASVAIAAIASCASSNKSSSPQKKQKKKQESNPEKVATAKATKATAPVSSASKTSVAQTVNVSSKPAPVATPAPATPPPVEVPIEEKKGKKAKETPEQRAARLERQRIAKLKKSEAAVEVQVEDNVEQRETSAPVTSAAAPTADGWEVVADKRKQKPKKAKAPEAPVAAIIDASVVGTAPTPVDQTTGTLKVEPKKVGVLIGPKGATMHSIQDLTETKITMPKTERDATAAATVSVVGTAEGVAKAISIMKELCNKGYALALEGENFQESSISVHNK